MSFELLSQLARDSSDGLLAFDRNRRVTLWNRAIERLSGVAAPAAVGQRLEDLFATFGEGVRRAHAALQEGALRGETAEITPGAPFTGGRYQPLRGEGGAVIGGFALLRDALEERERDFRLLAEAMPQLVWITNIEGKISYVNRRWYDYTGQTPGRMDMGLWTDVCHPDDLPRVLERRAGALREDREFSVEYRLRRHDGRYRWHLARSLPVADASGAPTHQRIGTATDIEDNRAVSAELERTKGLFETALQGFSEAFCLLDGEFRYVLANTQWLRLLNRENDPPIGQRFWDIFPHLRGSIVEQNLVRARRDRVEVRFEFYSTAAGRWLGIRAYPVGDGLAYFSTDIDARKRAEAELQGSRDQLSVILQGIEAGVIAYDPQGNYVFANESAARLLGFADAAGLMSVPLAERYAGMELLDEHDRPIDPSVTATRRALAGDRHPPELLVQYRRRGRGEFRWALVRSKPLYDEQERLQLVVTIIRDFTERRRAELERERFHDQALQERARLDAVVRQVDSGVMILDARTREAVFINERAREIWRMPDMPKHFSDRAAKHRAFRADGTPLPAEEWPVYRAIREGVRIDAEEMTVIRGDGTIGHIVTSAHPIRDARGEVAVVVTTLQDVTRIRREEQAASFLDEASRALAASLDYRQTLPAVARLAVPRLGDWCSIAVVESAGPAEIAVAHQDPAKIALAEEFRRRYPTDWQSAGGAARTLRTGEPQLLSAISPALIEAAARDADHLKIMIAMGISSVIYVPLPGREGSLGVLTLVSSRAERPYDESDLRLATELGRRAGQAIENARLYEQAQSAIRSRDSLISVSAHELLTPVSGSKLQMQLIRRRLDQGQELRPEQVRKMVDQTERQLDRLSRLVNEMLDLSRINLGKLTIERTDTDLSHLATDLIERMHGQLQAADCRLSTAIAPGVRGQIDSYRFEQVLTNLLSNAARYARGKAVEVTLATEEGGRVARLEVRDEGIGIRREDQERIFQRFERAATIDEGSGLGLGLFVVRQIVEAHGGTVALESEPGRGSRFTVRLPIDSPRREG